MRNVITIALTIATLFLMGCSIDDTPEVLTKDVLFKVAVKCDDLTFDDEWDDEIIYEF